MQPKEASRKNLPSWVKIDSQKNYDVLIVNERNITIGTENYEVLYEVERPKDTLLKESRYIMVYKRRGGKGDYQSLMIRNDGKVIF